MDLERTDSELPFLTRALRAGDLQRLVKIDRRHTGRSRDQFYKGRLDRALGASDIHISLGCDVDGTLVGAVMGSLQYGEFGRPEPTAILDTILVDPDYHGRGVGKALMEQLTKNLRALMIETVRTEVDWTEHDLMRFLGNAGFRPGTRLVLELPVGGR